MISKGWYSLIQSEEPFSHLNFDNIEEYSNSNSKYKILFEPTTGENFQFTILKKNWIRINTLSNDLKVITENILSLKKYLLVSLSNKNYLIINTGSKNLSGFNKFIRDVFGIKTTIISSTNLNSLYKFLKNEYENLTILEAKIINHSTNNYDGNLHIKNLKQPINKIMNNEKSYLSWIKVDIEINGSNHILQFYQSSSFYLGGPQSWNLEILNKIVNFYEVI